MLTYTAMTFLWFKSIRSLENKRGKNCMLINEYENSVNYLNICTANFFLRTFAKSMNRKIMSLP